MNLRKHAAAGTQLDVSTCKLLEPLQRLQSREPTSPATQRRRGPGLGGRGPGRGDGGGLPCRSGLPCWGADDTAAAPVRTRLGGERRSVCFPSADHGSASHGKGTGLFRTRSKISSAGTFNTPRSKGSSRASRGFRPQGQARFWSSLQWPSGCRHFQGPTRRAGAPPRTRAPGPEGALRGRHGCLSIGGMGPTRLGEFPPRLSPAASGWRTRRMRRFCS